MKVGFLFPGQGSQSIGMGKDLFENYEEVRNTYEKVKAITGIDVAKMTFDGPEEVLNKTQNTQICILTMSLAIAQILEKNNISACCCAGLSLGEYTALIYSKVLDFEEGIKLVQKRGEYMQSKVPDGNWKMAAILGLEEEKVQEAINQVSGFVRPVNFNCPGQIVVSGEEEAVEKLGEIAKEMGAKKVIPLKTDGPFHTEKLKEAAEALSKDLENVNINQCKNTVIKNIDGMPYKEDDNIREILKNHMINPVRFQNGIETMLDMGIDTFIEIGPGKTLSGFVKRMKDGKNIDILNINSVETLESTINYIKEKNK